MKIIFIILAALFWGFSVYLFESFYGDGRVLSALIKYLI